MLINCQLLDQLTEQAKTSQRLRMHLNLHESPESKAQRLLVALEPGTDLPIHRHPLVNETQMILRGSLKVIFYNDLKEITNEFLLNPIHGNYGIHTPKGQWHTLEVIESGTVIIEIKDGPYSPSVPEDIMK